MGCGAPSLATARHYFCVYPLSWHDPFVRYLRVATYSRPSTPCSSLWPSFHACFAVGDLVVFSSVVTCGGDGSRSARRTSGTLLVFLSACYKDLVIPSRRYAEPVSKTRTINQIIFSSPHDAGAGAAAGSDLSTAIPQEQREPNKGRGLARAGSVASALTFEGYADLSHANAAVAVADADVLTAEEEEQEEEQEEEEEAAAARDGKREGPLGGRGRNKTYDAPFVTNEAEDVAAHPRGVNGMAEKNGPAVKAPGLANNASGAPPPAAADAMSSAHADNDLESSPPLKSTSPRASSRGREEIAGGSTRPAAGSATAAAHPDSRPDAPVREEAPARLGTAVAPPPVAVGRGEECGRSVDDATGGSNAGNDRDLHGGNEGKREREADGAAEWWRDAMGPKSRRPVTRRSLVGGGAAAGVGTRSAGCILGGEKERDSCTRTIYGDDGAWRTAAPICGFSTESKQRNLEDFLKRRYDARGGCRE